MTPYYQDDSVTLYHADALELLADMIPTQIADVLLTDPPYGIGYRSGQYGRLPRSITGDQNTVARDAVIEWWGDRPALVFGSLSKPVAEYRMALVWDKGPALGMGALDLPWKPSWDLIFVRGKGFTGHRDGGVIYCPPVQSLARNGRVHTNEKPVALLKTLLVKCPPGVVLDPFAGSGSTLVAAKVLGRSSIGIEIEEKWCEAAAKRCSQETLGLAS